MRIIKCDACGKKINYETMVTVGLQLKNYELCKTCAAPVIKIVEKIK